MINRSSFGDFKCAHCHNLVPAAHFGSGVNHRNHCPYCLWSCHLDLFTAGDRLCACKGQMKPIGLTMKKSRNKYRLEANAELMLVHECVECTALSINRIAADDDRETILDVFQESLELDHRFHTIIGQHGIALLKAENREMINSQLFGKAMTV